MERTPVSSSCIAAVGYDAASHTLEIQFHSGGLYQYSEVPVDEHRDLMEAPSLGTFFAQSIRDRYPYRRV